MATCDHLLHTLYDVLPWGESKVSTKANATVGVAIFGSESLLLVGAQIKGAYCATLTLWESDSQKHGVCTQGPFRESAIFSVFLK